ncbi:MAG: response regulator transcription factor [Cyclobacteriaceae bacterium]
MRKTIFLYGASLAALLIVLQWLQYTYLIRALSVEFYIGIVAMLFAGLGIWAGLKITRKKIIMINPDFKLDERQLTRLGISTRELEVLRLIAAGHSNQEIAEKLFISLNTVKTHTSNLFQKLNVTRRTQAIQKAKELNLIG